MSDYPDDLINNLRGKFQGDREATIKHLIDTDHKKKVAEAIADFIQGQIQEEEEARERNLKKDHITDYKDRFGILSNEAREETFGKLSGNEARVLASLNELIDLIPTLPNRKQPSLYLIWLSIIGIFVERDGLDKYIGTLFSTASLYVTNLKKVLDTPDLPE